MALIVFILTSHSIRRRNLHACSSSPVLSPFPLASFPLQQGLSLDSDADLAAALNPAQPPPDRPAAPHTSLSYEQLHRVVLPSTTYPSAEQLVPYGLFLLEHAAGLYLIVGPEFDEELMPIVFGPEHTNAAALPRGMALPELNTEFSLRLWTIISALRARRPPFLPLSVIVPSDVEGRAGLARLLAEDKAEASPSYVDLLCEMHGAIQKRLQAPAP